MKCYSYLLVTGTDMVCMCVCACVQAMEVRKGTSIGKFLEFVKLQLSPDVS
jgi:hypothetical protein